MLALLLLASPLASPLVAQDSIDYPAVLWHVEGPLGAMALTEDTVYSGGYGLYRIDRASGEVLHVVDRGTAGGSVLPSFSRGPVVAGERILARRTQGQVVAYDLALEQLKWTWAPYATHGYAYPGVLAGDVYYVCAAQDLVALDARTGAELWKCSLPGQLSMTPGTDDERVFVGTSAGSLHAIDRETGELSWTFESESTFAASGPVLSGGVLYIGDRGIGRSANPHDFNSLIQHVDGPRAGALHAFDAATGEHLWGRVFGAVGLSRPCVTDEFVYAGFGRSLARFDRETGKIKTSRTIRTGESPLGSPTIVGARMLFGNLDGHLYAHDLETRTLDWAFNVPNAQVLDFLHTGDRIFVSSTRGLFALQDGEPSESGGRGKVLVWQAD